MAIKYWKTLYCITIVSLVSFSLQVEAMELYSAESSGKKAKAITTEEFDYLGALEEDEPKELRFQRLCGKAKEGTLTSEDLPDPLDILVTFTGDFDLLRIAARHGQRAVAEMLINGGALINSIDRNSKTALHLAAQHGHKEVTELFLDRGAQTHNVYADNKTTALHLAAQHGHKEVAELLINRDAPIDARDENNRTALHSATISGHTEVVDLLIARGAQINALDIEKKTPLHYSLGKDDQEVFKLILGGIIIKPTRKRCQEAYRCIFTTLLVLKKMGIPNVLSTMILLLEKSVCNNLGFILLNRLNNGLAINPASCITDDKVLASAAHIIVAGRNPLLGKLYQRAQSTIKALLEPKVRENNVTGYITAALKKKIRK